MAVRVETIAENGLVKEVLQEGEGEFPQVSEEQDWHEYVCSRCDNTILMTLYF
jgi:hypothetical protein